MGKITSFNGIDFVVQFKDMDIEKDGDISLGITDYLAQEIKIRSDMSEALTYQTLIHELVHACLFGNGLSGRTYTEEELCEFVGAHGKKIISEADVLMEGYYESLGIEKKNQEGERWKNA